MPPKVYTLKAMVFPVVMYGCESWTIKKAEHWRTDAFKLQCWRRLLRIPWTARRSNQSILKEINSEYSLRELMLKLKLQYCDHLIWRADSLDKTLKLGKIEGRWKRRWQMVGRHHRLNGHEFKQTGRWWRTGKPGELQSVGLQRVGHDWVTSTSLYFLPLEPLVASAYSVLCSEFLLVSILTTQIAAKMLHHPFGLFSSQY